MRIITVVFGLMLLAPVFSVNGWTAEPEKSPATSLENKQQRTERSKEEACDCCKKCLAAKKPTGIDKETDPKTGGCKDCCDQCGKVENPVPEKIPPEIIKKK